MFIVVTSAVFMFALHHPPADRSIPILRLPGMVVQGAAAVDQTVPARLRSIIAKHFKVDESKVTATTAFVKDLKADELDLVELVMAYEREFKIEITDAEADPFHLVQDVVAYLRKRGVLK